MQNKISDLFIVSLVVLSVSTSQVMASSGTAGIPTMLKEFAGAKSDALGNSLTAGVDDVSSLAINPAGLASVSKLELSLGYVMWFAGMNYFNVASTYKTSGKTGTFGLSFTGFSAGEFDNFDVQGNTLPESLYANDFLLTLGWSPRFPKNVSILKNFSAGIATKVVRSTLADTSVIGLGFDAGLLYKFRFLNYTSFRKAQNWIAGFSVRNIGPSVSFLKDPSSLPMDVRFGFAWAPVLSKKVIVMATADGVWSQDLGIYANAGCEITILKNYYIRFGNSGFMTANPSFSGGIGLKVKAFSTGIVMVDYAIKPVANLGLTHSVSLIFKKAK
jgi:hypothetical protein